MSESVRQFYKFFNHTKKTEIRVFGEKYPTGKSFFVENEDEFTKKVKDLNLKEKVDVYIGCRDRQGTKDEDVISSDFILIDFDGPEAKEMYLKFKEFCEINNLIISMTGFSGGGYHAYIKHRLKIFENELDSKNYKVNVLNRFKKILLQEGIEVDSKVFNLSRVMRILGSFSNKRQQETKILEYKEDINLEINSANLHTLLDTFPLEDVSNEELADVIQILEKYKCEENDPWLYDLIKNKVEIRENTGRNDVVVKYAAMWCIMNHLEQKEIESIANAVFISCKDSNTASFMGWVAQVRENNKYYDGYKNHINSFITENKYPLRRYILTDKEKLENKIYVIENKIKALNINDQNILDEQIENILLMIRKIGKLRQMKFLEELSKKSGYSIMTLKNVMKNLINEELQSKQITEVFKTEEGVDNDYFTKIGQAKKFLSKVPVFYEGKNQFWVWNSERFCWEEKDETDILNLLRKYTIIDTVSSKDKTEILEALKQAGRENKPEEIKQTWVQFKDKIIDIETNETFKAMPKYFVANPINWELGESEETPTIDKLFSSWVDKKDLNVLYEIFAFCLVPKYFIHSFIFLYGPPGTGKSTFVNLLCNFVGKKNTASTSIERINSNSRFEPYSWHKKLVITMSEVSNVNDLKNSGLVNQATAEDPIRAEIKGGRSFDFVNYGKFIYPTNKLLRVDSEDGFGRRVRTIQFKHRFEKEKDVLDEIPEYEFKNLAKKSLRIAKELWTKRNFSGDLSISERMKHYQNISKTPLEQFLDDYCDLTDPSAMIKFSDFYCEFAKFLKSTGKDIATKIITSKNLKKVGFELKNHNWRIPNSEDINRTEYVSHSTVFGIKLNDNNDLKLIPVSKP